MDKQNYTLLILKYLWENADDNSPVSIDQINQYLVSCGMKAKDARTIRNSIMELANIGVDIVETRTNHYEYSIGTRHFEVPEIKLLVDAVQSSRFISPKKSKSLIEKLSAFAGPRYASIINRQLYVDQRFKSTNESVMRSVDAIQDALAEKRKVTFQYLEYTLAKEKVARRDGMYYVVSPFSLIWNGDNYYMIGHTDSSGIIQKYRIDRIDHLSMLEESSTEPPHDYEVGDFFSQEFSMLSGTECDVELSVENGLINNIIDRFGENVHIEVSDDAHFIVKTTVDLSSNFYAWVFASCGKIKILSPKKAIDDFKHMIQYYANVK